MLLTNLINDFNFVEEVFGYGNEYPAIQLHSSEENLLLAAEMPGISAEELELSVTEDVVTISAQKKELESEEKNLKLLRSELRRGKLVRKVELPFEVDVENVKASLTDGLLSVVMPIKESNKPKKINVKGE